MSCNKNSTERSVPPYYIFKYGINTLIYFFKNYSKPKRKTANQLLMMADYFTKNQMN